MDLARSVEPRHQKVSSPAVVPLGLGLVRVLSHYPLVTSLVTSDVGTSYIYIYIVSSLGPVLSNSGE